MVSSVKKEVIYMQVIHKNHMEILWHDYAEAIDDIPITSAGIIENLLWSGGQVLCFCHVEPEPGVSDNLWIHSQNS